MTVLVLQNTIRRRLVLVGRYAYQQYLFLETAAFVGFLCSYSFKLIECISARYSDSVYYL